MNRDGDHIKIVEETDRRKRRKFQLYVGKDRNIIFLNRRASIYQGKNGDVYYNFQVSGPLQHNEMKLIIEGLIELSFVADQLMEKQDAN